ncbi:hypothetical protein SUGI_0205810 [Cryptomeria japonica]|nr:hypothetical protein SUGI_0205810 [Cryptomeria japonica]
MEVFSERQQEVIQRILVMLDILHFRITRIEGRQKSSLRIRDDDEQRNRPTDYPEEHGSKGKGKGKGDPMENSGCPGGSMENVGHAQNGDPLENCGSGDPLENGSPSISRRKRKRLRIRDDDEQADYPDDKDKGKGKAEADLEEDQLCLCLCLSNAVQEETDCLDKDKGKGKAKAGPPHTCEDYSKRLQPISKKNYGVLCVSNVYPEKHPNSSCED